MISMRLINADSLKAHYSWWHNTDGDMKEQAEVFDWIVDAQPTIDTVTHGYWINDDIDDQVIVLCSECNRWNTTKTAFCPHCGAKMN